MNIAQAPLSSEEQSGEGPIITMLRQLKMMEKAIGNVEE